MNIEELLKNSIHQYDPVRHNQLREWVGGSEILYQFLVENINNTYFRMFDDIQTSEEYIKEDPSRIIVRLSTRCSGKITVSFFDNSQGHIIHCRCTINDEGIRNTWYRPKACLERFDEYYNLYNQKYFSSVTELLHTLSTFIYNRDCKKCNALPYMRDEYIC